jgi:hypothetical protein
MSPHPLRRLSLPGVAIVFALSVAWNWAGAAAQPPEAFPDLRRDPEIQYDVRPTHDPIAELDRRLHEGDLSLSFDGSGQGYLRSLLEALNVPVESQVVAFSKTSFQASRISPSNPRAIYFNDDVALGWVRGGPVVEIAAVAPEQGVVFYVLHQRPFGAPRFQRQDAECLTCHITRATLGVPGLGIGSVLPAADGLPLAPARTPMSDHRTPFEDRWGGWYVTGGTGRIRHLGNTVATNPDSPQSVAPNMGTLASLEGRFPIEAYLSPYSDIAALMVLEHQTHMTNLLTRVGWQSRTTGRDAGTAFFNETVRSLVDYMLFAEEAPILDRIQSTSGFAAAFSQRGPFDRSGRSLRELDLRQRLMRYPCSYMIYSPSFEHLPQTAKDMVYRRMWEVLSGRDSATKYARLSRADRKAVLEILRDTKPDLPAYFRPLS